MNKGNDTQKGTKKKQGVEALGEEDADSTIKDDIGEQNRLDKEASALEEKIEDIDNQIEHRTELLQKSLYDLPIEDHTVDLTNMSEEKAKELSKQYQLNKQEQEERKENMTELDKLLEARERLTMERIAIGKILTNKQHKDKEFEMLSAKYYLEEEEKRVQQEEEELEIKTRGGELLKRQKTVRQKLRSWNERQDRVEEDKEITEGTTSKWEEAKVRGATSEVDLNKSKGRKKTTAARKNSRVKAESNTSLKTPSQQRIMELEARLKSAQLSNTTGKEADISARQRRINELEQQLSEVELKVKKESKEVIALSASQQRINELEKKLEEREEELCRLQDLLTRNS